MQFKFLSSGISSIGFETEMMKARVHEKNVADQKQQLLSRILKLKKEEEKAMKRIKFMK